MLGKQRLEVRRGDQLLGRLGSGEMSRVVKREMLGESREY